MARLVIFDETVRGVDLPDHAVIVGRSRKADIPIRDRLLSRKHCTFLPVAAAVDGGAAQVRFRVIDLKSANGTFVNGGRIEKHDLEFDDVIEIGNTVMVLLDTETWNRGEGIARLRNPLKAQELIGRLNRLAGKRNDENAGNSAAPPATTAGPPSPATAPEVGGAPEAPPAEPAPDLARWWSEEAGRGGVLDDLLLDCLEAKVAARLLHESPHLQAALEAAAGRLLSEGAFPLGRLDLRARLRGLLEEALAEQALAARGRKEAPPPAAPEGGEMPAAPGEAT